jgi:primary-amine oxidase
MMHEEGNGLSYLGGSRAYGKMLTLWCGYNMGGYFYIHRWKFRDDGVLMPEVGLTGPVQHISKGDSNEYGSLVGKNKTYAPSHVHNIYFCLDFDIDGTENVVEEFNYQQDAPGSISAKHSWTTLKKETGRTTSADNFRFWRVVNPKSKNNHGLPRSYELVPGGNGKFFGTDKEKFAHAQFWVTKHHPKEHPVDTRPLATILPSYLNDEDIENQNVVVWYVLNIHHIPRTEDWPAMPVEWSHFTLRPRDFLDTSPVQPK